MNDRNNSMTDTTPLRKITAALGDLKKEVESLDLRIGVVGQTLLQHKIKHHHHQVHFSFVCSLAFAISDFLQRHNS